ncbi:MAG TPA: glycosyltransferase family 4 protein [Acidimicrobiales bacterium]|nr:glycosyltransferase family 4 protein [Acidimicrobiales bacterium]
MKVALVSAYDLAVPGGVQAQVMGLARALRAAGDEVVIIAPGTRPTTAEDLEVVTVGPVRRLPANGSRAPVAPTPGAMRRTRRALAARSLDLVHVHEPLVPGPALAAASWRDLPVVGTFHRARAGAVYVAYGHALRGLVRRLDDRVAVSEVARATLWAAAGPCPVGILPNAVDLGRFDHAAPTPVAAPTVLFIGRAEARKGLDVLAEAFAGLPGDLRLQIVGEGPEAPALRRRFGADARIEWLGALSDAELAGRLAAAEILVAPSRGGESFGVVLLEAMAAGTAVLASDLPGYRLAAGDAAAYSPPGDALALRGHLQSLLADPEARRRLVAAGRTVAARHSFADLAAAYAERYALAAAHAAARRRGRSRRAGHGGARTLGA